MNMQILEKEQAFLLFDRANLQSLHLDNECIDHLATYILPKNGVQPHIELFFQMYEKK